MENVFATKEDLLTVIENEAHIRVDSFVQNAIDLAEKHTQILNEMMENPLF